MSPRGFRSNATATLSSPEQLDTVVRVTRPRSWIALGAVGLVLVVFVVWTILGTVQTTFPGAGVLSTQYGTFNAVSPRAGQIVSVSVSQGDAVKAGERLATVETADGRTVDVKALDSGHVVEMLAYPSDHVAEGATIATVQPDDQDLRSFVFVPVSGRQPIAKGMPVQISVTTVPSEQYGLLLGTVAKVSDFPVTTAGVDALLNNKDIASIVTGSGPVIQVEITLTKADTPSGYAWTSGDGPPKPLSAGTLVNATVITSVQHPISLLFPSVRAPK
jgi:hypothetical protein